MYQHACFQALHGFLYIRAAARLTARHEEGKKEVTEFIKATSVVCTEPVRMIDDNNLVLSGFSVTKDFTAARENRENNFILLKYLSFVVLKYLSFVFFAFLSPGKKRDREKDLGREEHYCNFAMHNPL